MRGRFRRQERSDIYAVVALALSDHALHRPVDRLVDLDDLGPGTNGQRARSRNPPTLLARADEVETLGTASLSSSRRLPISPSSPSLQKPVTLPPGRAMLWTSSKVYSTRFYVTGGGLISNGPIAFLQGLQQLG